MNASNRDEKLKSLLKLVRGNPLVSQYEKILLQRNKKFITEAEIDELLGLFENFENKLEEAFLRVCEENPKEYENFTKKKAEIDKKYRQIAQQRKEKTEKEEKTSSEDILKKLNG